MSDLLKIAADAENDCSCALWDYPEVLRSAHVRIEELEAKLAKAMSALSGHSTARCFGSGEVLGLSLSDSPMGREVLARMDHARTTIAELKGEPS